MGLLYTIYQSVQDGQEREREASDDLSGQEEAGDIPVSLVHLLANPIGRAAGENKGTA
ncbi:hypothetical protein B0G52_11777 [Cohnella sp. SGD-V74]|jgi:hypothetical protein|uniref:hypothetical protein n=1 Tax=unclassified Cohnella TaxID=2636738 RepID=UPI000D44D5D6|nr:MULTISPECIES: hypothetical protein [unclassified Cohnella]PRX65723.1 hypothetical protein B0G52_11777 [Cohnella sp. SGD-V74]